ncbi:MAG: elongation factor Ts [Candidatus Komeilibacteria bacterium CG_4_10_14_0_2_um_filter_37_10]|uniref:Elongation factor Ts n=1 Tax=Candidatus Komeilibacteria bacterium CG_4_10_14_0_2_um_filter_37_10 TaxID=1974470 RepID=A0A2M7VGP2_9BACT|nr:MAG: elongation factor Ts [Candidatus Komeilibacteria bacterium CG_4_10_14_0_2_um_filter_37_10]
MSMDLIKKLRNATGAGMNDCHLALKENNNDYDLACEWLRKRGQKIASKKQDRQIKAGLIESYIHPGGQVGVLLEVGCETDFVARNEDFKIFVHEVALQIAATAPQYVSPEDIPTEILEKEKEIYRAEMADQNKPTEIVEKIIMGKLEKFYQINCLLKQLYIKDDSMTMEKMLVDVTAKIGEKIVLSKFTRYAI